LNTTIFIPKTIKVGYQNRNDTYTKKLAYIIYYDQKNVLRKQKSWEGWRDKNIEPQEFVNEPTSGFVLNKKVGDYKSDWHHRKAYIRVYDSRNFEFEITVENLLYILENSSSIKGKGLEGQFIYGWSAKDIILIPCDSPDYKELMELNDLRHEKKKFDNKNMIIGATYKSNNNIELTYLGRYYQSNDDDKETMSYFFYNRESKYHKFDIVKSLSGYIIDVINENCIEDYANLMDELLTYSNYSIREQKYDEYKDYTLDEFKESLNKRNGFYSSKYYAEVNGKIKKYYYIDRYYGYWRYSSSNTEPKYNVYTLNKGYKDERIIDEKPVGHIFNQIKPKYLVTYDSNKNIIKEWK